MKLRASSERVLIKEVMQATQSLRKAARGLSIGPLIKSIRNQLGLSQRALAKRAKVPQSIVSKVEQGRKDIQLSTLTKILNALSCDLIISPLLRDTIDAIRRKQARKIAEKQIQYLKGTMHLEGQQPDSHFIEELMKQEEERLLHGPSAKLWEE